MTINDIQKVVCDVAPLYPVISVDLFGSYANNEFSDQSDVDLLVCFDENVASLFDLSGLKLDVQDRLNKPVDIVAGPLKPDSYLIVNKKVRLYEL